MVDYGVVFGVSGLFVALISLTYSRAQAGAAKRQAEAEWRQARIGVSNAIVDRVRHARARIVSTPRIVQEYSAANPVLMRVAEEVGGLETVVVVRDFLDATQDVFFLRKEGFISDHDWRGWITSAIPIARMPTVRLVFENGVARQAFDPLFAQFFRPFVEGDVGDDPLGRVRLSNSAVVIRPADPVS